MSRSQSARPPAPFLPRSAREKLVGLIRGILVSQLALLVVLVGAVIFIQHEFAAIDERVAPAASATRLVRESMADAKAGLHRWVLIGDPTGLQRFEAAVVQVNDNLDTIDALAADDPTLTDLAGNQRRATVDWIVTYAEPMATSATGAAARSASSQADADAAFDRFRTASTELAGALRDRQAGLIERSSDLLWVALLLAMVIMAGGVLVTLRPAVRALRFIGPPLEALHATVRRLEAGELSARADPQRGVVEIREVSAALNQMAAITEARSRHDAEQLRLAEAVREIGVIVGDTYDLDEIVAESGEPIVTSFDAQGIWIRAFEDTVELEPEDPGSVYPPRSSPQWLITAVRRLAQRLWERQETYDIRRDEPTDPVYLDQSVTDGVFAIPDVAGADSMLIVPMGAGRTCVGYIGLRRTPEQPPWSPLEIAALQRVGGDVGRAILHARVYAQDRRLVSQLRELDDAKTDFVSMVSHELRTPLASIIGHLEIVQGGDAGEVDDDTRPFLAAIDRNATRLTTLIEDLLMLSRIEQRADHTTRTPLDLVDTARAVIGMYAETAARKDIRLQLQADAECPVLGDPSELEHVITNLVGNAIKYSPAGSTVQVAVRPPTARSGDGDTPPTVELAVADQGIGIAAADLDKIFDRFYRVGSAQTQSVPGTGLGLAITRLVVERHGGAIAVESELGAGSTFTVSLPAEAAAPVPTAAPLLTV